MEKLTKTYVRYLVWGREWEESEIEIRDPELISSVVNLDDITCFYFYDKSFIKDGEKIYQSEEKENVSEKIYVGNRVSIEDAILATKGQTKEYLENLVKSGRKVVAICATNRGLTEMYEGDITLNEYMETKKNSKKI